MFTQLPVNWPTLLTTSNVKYVNDDFSTATFIDSSWFSDLPNTSFTSDTLSSLQREKNYCLCHPLVVRGSHLCPSMNLLIFRGRHPSLKPFVVAGILLILMTCILKRKHQVNSAILHQSVDTPLDGNLYSALITVQDSYPVHLGTHLSYLEHYSCATQTNPDTVHYGAMLKDHDRAAFEQDMVREVSDLLCTQTTELTEKSSVSSHVKTLPAIWSFCRKRAPDWTIIKHKACLCPLGGK